IHWVDGSDAEWDQIAGELVEAGTLVKLDEDEKANSFWAASDPADVARVEGRTFICSRDEADSGPTNNWMDPDEMKDTLRPLFDGAMRGRTMYVMPCVMGHIDARDTQFGVEVNESAYVVAYMLIMKRIGQ